MPYKEEVKKLYARMSEADKQTDDGQEITTYVYPPTTVGIGDMMVDGDCMMRMIFSVIFPNSKENSSYSISGVAGVVLAWSRYPKWRR